MPTTIALSTSPELGAEKRCRCCGEFWPADREFFASQTSSKDGLSPRCLACIKAGLWYLPKQSIQVAMPLTCAPLRSWCMPLFMAAAP